MLEPERHDGLAFASVEEEQVPLAVERLKRTLPAEPRECPACGYVGEAFRWGIKTFPARVPLWVALVLCCPGCERPTDLPAVDAGGRGGV